MERGFLNAYTYDAPPRGGGPPPKRPRSARGTGENVEEEIDPSLDPVLNKEIQKKGKSALV